MYDISKAQPSDIGELVDLLTILFEQEEDFAPDPQKQRRALTMLLDSPTVGVVLVCRSEGKPIGMVSLLFTVSTAEGGRVCWIEDLVVRPERRGAGVGSALLDAAIEEAKSRDLLRIALLTDRSNTKARRFYARYGFAESMMMPLRLKLRLAELH
jgi:GNAT superfamily N-acetyltransferase